MVDTTSHSTVCYQHQLELSIELPRESALFWPLWWRISLSIRAQNTINHGHGRSVKWKVFANSTISYQHLTMYSKYKMISKKKIVRNEGQFVLLKVLLVNCSPLHLFSHFSGHKGRDQCNLIGRDIVIMSKIQSSSTRREQRTLFYFIFFSGNYASVTIYEFWVVLCNTAFSFPQYRLTFLKTYFLPLTKIIHAF